MTLDSRAFSKAVAAYIPLASRDAADVLNSKAGDVCLKAVDKVKRADAAKMDAKLKRSSNRGVMLKSGRRSRNKKTSFQEFQASKYVYAVINFYRRHGYMPKWALGVMPKKIAQTGAALTGDAMSAVARQFVNAKKSSIGYIAVGFIMVAKFFGKSVTTKVSDEGWAGSSTGKKATARDLTAVMINFSRGAHLAPRVEEAIQDSMYEVTDDLLTHLSTKLQKSAQKVGFSSP